MKRTILYILALTGVAIFMIPMLWTISTAFKSRQQVYTAPSKWIPTSYRWTDTAGATQRIAVLDRIDHAADQVRLLAGPQKGLTLAVDQTKVSSHEGQLLVQLQAALPIPAKLLKTFDTGVAKIRVPGSNDAIFVPTSDLHEVFDPQWRNFTAAWRALPISFSWFVLNTYTITIVNVIGVMLSCSLVAYGFARFHFPGRGPLFLLLLSTMMLPAQVTMIPMFMFWSKLHAIDTFAPLTIPSFFGTSAFAIFLLRQFYLGLPRELDEAAMLDGCGPFRIWWQILLPLSRPALITIGVLTFLASWDDFLGPLIYLDRLPNYTVSLALRLFQDEYGTDFSLLMAAALVHIVPVVVLFFVAQRYFVKGIATTGMKA